MKIDYLQADMSILTWVFNLVRAEAFDWLEEDPKSVPPETSLKLERFYFRLTNGLPMWIQSWLGQLYSALYANHRSEYFAFDDVKKLVKSEGSAKVALSSLRKAGFLYVHGRLGRRRLYRICDPDVMVLISAEKLLNIENIKQAVYSRLLGILTCELFRRIPGLRSIVLYGSAARGSARSDSDIDLLVVFESKASFGERIELLAEVEFTERVEEELSWLYMHGIDTHISFLPMNPAEVKASPPILLDIVEDGIALVDDGFFRDAADRFKAKLERLGARRIFISHQDWYWDLKPTIKFGEVVAI